jgi:cytochrome c
MFFALDEKFNRAMRWVGVYAFAAVASRMVELLLAAKWLRTHLLRWLCLLVGISTVGQVFGADPVAATALLEDSKCVKCHALAKKKDGPAYRDVAAKFRGDPEAEKKLIHHVTSGERVKFPDGHEEDHKKVKTTDMAQIKNLVTYIQSLEGGTKY